ncbi:MAG: hypothetical protein F2934_08400 [Actinobacteria bacterium]|uniref:Unannotated protein n=1 Tax=freshwater metagenome TaxID=449393 RepID=A0A6J6RAP0_9ZZZZ|nr:hypothetical protein [Actinomycetota bacterium]MSZ04386.1 hypothetical protein [Actinomycetota bacterium]MTB07133.1 hypothetical protein [Actinomycetota bacterium]
MNKSRAALGVLVGGALALAACGGASKSSDVGTTTTVGSASDSGHVLSFAEETGGVSATNEGVVEGGTLNILDYNSGASNLDPQRIYSAADLSLLGSTVLRTLTSYKIAPGKDGTSLVADLATDTGTASADAKTWTFTLRDGITFEDGSPITCADIQYGVSRTWAHDVTADDGPLYATQYLDVPEDYPGPFTATAEQEAAFSKGVECRDPKTIVFHLKLSVSDFNFTVSLLAFGPVPKAADTGDKYTLRPMSSGPFKIETYDEGKTLVMVRNDKWSQASDPVRTPHLDRIVWHFGLAEAIIDERMIADQGDDQAAITYAGLASQSLQTVFSGDQYADRRTDGYNGFVSYTIMNLKTVNCLAIRKAIWLAIDREAIRTAVGGPFTGTFASGFINPRLAVDFAEATLPEGLNADGTANTEAAKALMAQAKDDPKCASAYKLATETGLRFDHGASEAWTKVISIWMDSLKAVGIKIIDNPIEPKDLYAAFASNPGDMMRGGWATDWNNASTVIPPLFIKDGGSAYGNFWDDPDYPGFVERVNAALVEVDRAKQASMWKALNQWLVDQVWSIPGTYTRAQYLVGSKVRNAYNWYPFGWYAVGNIGLAA